MRSRFELPETLLNLVLSAFLSIASLPAIAQTQVGGNISLQGLPGRTYAAYMPKSFGSNRNLPIVVSFHPLNSLEWNASSWCKRMRKFAEEAQVIVLCPDGGNSIRVDDPAEISYANELLESFSKKYNLQSSPVYVHGYSLGTRTALRFAIRYPRKVSGIMLMSSVVDFKDADLGLYNLSGIPVYMVQGKEENVQQKLLEFRRQLHQNGAFAEVNLVSGYGHELGEEVFNTALLDSWQWVSHFQSNDEYKIEPVTQMVKPVSAMDLRVLPHPALKGHAVLIADGDLSTRIIRVNVFNANGEQVEEIENIQRIVDIGRLPSGVYIVVCELQGEQSLAKKVFIK